jgi:hypothetical protein
MDYLAQAGTLLHRAKETDDVEERTTHLNMAAEMLAMAIDGCNQRHSWSIGSGLSWQEQTVLGLFQVHDLRPGQLFPIQSLVLGWGTRGSSGELLAAVKRLELKGLVATDSAETGCQLTEAGYVRP